MDVSNRFSSDSHAWSALIRHNGEEGMFFNAAFVVAFVEFFERLSEVDDETGVVVRTAQQQFEVGRQRWASSSPSTRPVPHPEAREHDRIGTTDAARILDRTPRAVRKQCEKGCYRSGRQDGPRGDWRIDRTEVEQVAAGSGGRGHAPPDPAGGDR